MQGKTKPQSRLASRENTSMPSFDLTVVYRRIEALKPDPANPRLHSKKQIRQIARSIETFGFNVPVLVDAELKVIAGHGRLLACGELGRTEVPTLCLDHLTPAQARAFMIADNRLTEIASWDDKLLAQQLKDLSLLGLDFSIEVTGFEIGEIDLRIAALEDMPEQADDDPADAVPELPTRPPLTKMGDVWLLGRHRVMCGNALDAAAFGADGRGTRGHGLQRRSIQRADSWSRGRPRCDPPSRLPDGLGRDGQRGIHCLSQPGLPEPRRVQR
jgi:hypothetical protein